MKNINKKTFFSVFILFLLFLVFYLFIYDPKYTGSVMFSNIQKPILYVHRGGGYFGPDNSLKASLQSLEQGFVGVDIDVQQTKDGHLVVFHDLSIDRLTNGTGKVKELNLNYLTSLDLGQKFSSSTKGHLVCDFDTFVSEVVSKGGKITAELKVTGIRKTDFEEKAIEIIKRNKAYDSVIFSSFNPIVLWRLKLFDPNIKTMYIFMDTNWNPQLLGEIKKEDLVNLPWILRQEWFRVFVRKVIRPDYLSVNIEVATSTIEKVIRLGYPVFLWTPESENEIEKAIDYGPFGIYTDNQFIAKELLK